MSLNSIRNALYLALVFFFIICLGIIFAVIAPAMQKFYNGVNAGSPNALLDTTWMNWLTFKALFIQGFYVLCSLLVFFALVSSVYDTQTLQGYLVAAVGGLIATPTIIWIVSSFWNTFSVMGITLSEVNTVFVTNFVQIMVANLVFGLLAFIFARRGVQ